MALEFHYNDYSASDPRMCQQPSEPLMREMPKETDVIIVGAGPAGMIAAAQLSYFPTVSTLVVEKSHEPLKYGRAEGIQKRTVETFQAFGFADQLVQESYQMTGMNFWRPDPDDETRIVRAAVTEDDPRNLSEFPHLISNQPRVLAYFQQYMQNAPRPTSPYYGVKFLRLEHSEQTDFPIRAHFATEDGEAEKVVYAKYLIGADGAHSSVRASIGRELQGNQANRAWGVLAALADTDFPDIRMKCAIQSKSSGSLLLIPREGGYLFRMYVDLGDVTAENQDRIRATSADESIAKINRILAPYSIDVKHVAWHSVYEVAHRITDSFDACVGGSKTPNVFIAGDACHTHSAKAGQGMNVSLQDGFNIGWKIGYVASGIASSSILNTYNSERMEVAQNLIDFDREWYGLFAKKVDELHTPEALEEYYVKTAEFPAGFMTMYSRSMLTASQTHQSIATGYPIGKRFKSHEVVRVCDMNTVHLGHQATADGRWRLYVFADRPNGRGHNDRLGKFADWLSVSSRSPLNTYKSQTSYDDDALFDVHVVYPQNHRELNLPDVPQVFKPRVGKYRLSNLNKVYACSTSFDVFSEACVSDEGAIVVVRPDQYVGAVLPLGDPETLADYLKPIFGQASS
ncbi:FAD-dependent monooxygenase [Actinomyces slackii]|uniref:Pentachlorophenol 4-monooxygenase n=1 Tax=Actinomyces slackii TaxID=52774 RepID=A0A3S4TE12_9ACTO|nr:FAD-dependent monooxygenase [Actinomyces slackii]VEG75781.1 Pentachlorophenol 4-monooxygenase [Actinomyces slackii]